jgi:S1-C subfamily serine protease
MSFFSAMGTMARIAVLLSFCTSVLFGVDTRDMIVMIRVSGGPDVTATFGAGILFYQGNGKSYVATAAHVVAQANNPESKASIQAEFRPKLGEPLPAKLVRYSAPSNGEGLDLAVLEVDNAPKIGDQEGLNVMLPDGFEAQDEAYIIGNMNARDWRTTEPESVVKASPRELRLKSQEVNNGASGGGVFDSGGALLGMVVKDENPLAIALPINLLLEKIKEWNLPVGLQPNQKTITRAGRSLRDRGTALDVSAVKRALVASDVPTLEVMTNAGLSTTMIEEALRQPAEDAENTAARRFFASSIHSPDAARWFAEALKRGVNPNLTVPAGYYPEEALFVTAMRAGNATAMEALLASGASPHGYQDLFLTSYASTRFLFPLAAIADDNRFTLAEKQDLARHLVAAGMVVPEVIKSNGFGWQSEMYHVNELTTTTAPALGIHLQVTKDLCEDPEPVLCRRSKNACGVIAAMPKRLSFTHNTNMAPFYLLQLKYLLAITDRKMYFLALTNDYGAEYVIVETARDGTNWIVSKYMQPEAGMGLCRKDGDVQPEYCWRQIPMHEVAFDRMRFDSWGDEWKTSRACAELGR